MTKARLSLEAPLDMVYIYGEAAVFTILRSMGSMLFLKHDWTGDELMVDEKFVDDMSPEEAENQAAIYQSLMEDVRRRNNRS